MRSKQLTAIVHRMFEGDLLRVERYVEFFTDDVIRHGPESGTTIHGLKALMAADAEHVKFFRKLKGTIGHVVAHESKVSTRWTVAGELITATNKTQPSETVNISGHSLYVFSNEKVCEFWVVWDWLGILEQVGAINVAADPADLVNQAVQPPTSTQQVYFKKATLLSAREIECLQHLLLNRTAKETAAELKLSYRTVEYYLDNIKTKLDCSNKKELYAAAYELKRVGLL